MTLYKCCVLLLLFEEGKSFIKPLYFLALMVINQDRSKRKPSGGKYKKLKIKLLNRMGRKPSHTKIGERSDVLIRVKGGQHKQKILHDENVNLYDPKTKKYSKEKISTTTDNPANRHFARRNIVTKGAIIVTSKGKARITSRPGQTGTLNAVLIDSK